MRTRPPTFLNAHLLPLWLLGLALFIALCAADMGLGVSSDRVDRNAVFVEDDPSQRTYP